MLVHACKCLLFRNFFKYIFLKWQQFGVSKCLKCAQKHPFCPAGLRNFELAFETLNLLTTRRVQAELRL
jgi:hypothetical protein